MEKCKVCGRTNPLEDANFCYYCGASLREGAEGEALNRGMLGDSEPKAVEQTDEERELLEGRPFSKWRWFATLMLLCIPIYGWLAFLVIMAVSAFGTTATKERKEMAKGILLFLVAAIVFVVVVMAAAMSDPEFAKQFNELMEQYSTTVESASVMLWPFR